MLYHVLVFHSILWLNTNQYYEYNRFFLFIHEEIDI